MKVIRFAAAIAVLALGGAASAQSLEETYANLCSDKAAAKTETCVMLRKGLIEKLNAESEQPAQAAAQPPAKEKAAAPDWGLYLDLVKGPRVDILAEGMLALDYQSPIVTYEWEVPGQVMRVSSTQPDGSTVKAATLQWNQQGGLVETSAVDGAQSVLVPQPDGSFIAESARARIIQRKIEHGTIEIRMEVKGAKGWELAWAYHRMVFTPETIGLLRQIHANSINVAKINASIPSKYRDPEYLRMVQERERERLARKKSGGGLFGSLVGAAVGAYAGAAGGLDTGETVGAVMKGMSITNPNSPMAAALSSTGDQLLTGGGATSALASGMSGGAVSGGGSYPTKPNLATGACSGFTEGNYRTKALEGGGDSQLNTMCGQAFEYYTMYKRAIAQGYSEADANRTYAAHEQSARVASGYLSSHGAN